MPIWTEISTGQPVDSDLGPHLFHCLGVDVEGVFIPGLDRKMVTVLGVIIGISHSVQWTWDVGSLSSSKFSLNKS